MIPITTITYTDIRTNYKGKRRRRGEEGEKVEGEEEEQEKRGGRRRRRTRGHGDKRMGNAKQLGLLSVGFSRGIRTNTPG